MGTNYFLHGPACVTCGRSDEPMHICKSHVMFRGHFEWDDDECGYVPNITTWRAWKQVLTYECKSNGHRIVDEYGAEHSLADFVEAVESSSPEERRRQYDWCAAHGRKVDVIEEDADWLDADGFSFYGGGFS